MRNLHPESQGSTFLPLYVVNWSRDSTLFPECVLERPGAGKAGPVIASQAREAHNYKAPTSLSTVHTLRDGVVTYVGGHGVAGDTLPWDGRRRTVGEPRVRTGPTPASGCTT